MGSFPAFPAFSTLSAFSDFTVLLDPDVFTRSGSSADPVAEPSSDLSLFAFFVFGTSPE
ncbi:hypothetical protein GCM10010372_35580 [Streptomyces tauricus]|nr:hypothetical protein GCM10010372_35580 [Streptomyces tauricus]